MRYALLDNNGTVKQVQPNEQQGFIEVDDNVHCGMVKDGVNFVNPPMTLDQAKTTRLQELEVAFITASKLPVTVGTKTYNGGKESALAIRDYIQLVTDSGGTVYTLWDINNATANYTIAEAKAIMLAIATPVSQAEFNMNAKKNAINAITLPTNHTELDYTNAITAVNAVVW